MHVLVPAFWAAFEQADSRRSGACVCSEPT